MALGDLFMLLNIFIPKSVPATKYLFYKSFQLEQSEVRILIANQYKLMLIAIIVES